MYGAFDAVMFFAAGLCTGGGIAYIIRRLRARD
jgi:hypothetical protein